MDNTLKSCTYILNNFIEFKYQTLKSKMLIKLINEELYLKFDKLKTRLITTVLSLIDYKNEGDLNFLLTYLEKVKFDSNINRPIKLDRGVSEIIESKTCELDLEDVDQPTRMAVLEAIYRNNSLNLMKKNEYKSKLLIHKGEETKFEKYTLDASLPDRAKKEKIWDLLVLKQKNFGDHIYEAYMKGFAHKSQYHLIKDYLKDRFFTDFIFVKNNHSSDYAVKFFKYLNPSFIINEDVNCF